MGVVVADLLSSKLTVLVVLGVTAVLNLGGRASQKNGSRQVVVFGVGGLVLATGAIQVSGLLGRRRRALLELIKRLRRGRLGGDFEGNKGHCVVVSCGGESAVRSL